MRRLLVRVPVNSWWRAVDATFCELEYEFNPDAERCNIVADDRMVQLTCVVHGGSASGIWKVLPKVTRPVRDGAVGGP